MSSQSDQKIRIDPSGLLIFNRRTGLNVLLEEIRAPKHLWARAPRQVSFALTNACDLACPYCYAPKVPAALDLGKVTAWLKELDSNGCLGVGFGGGEPTMYRYFAEVCKYAAKETALAVTFTTHAHLVDTTLAKKIEGNVHFIRLSMDGVGVTYETLRGRSFGTFRTHLEVVRGLAPFGINFVVNERTLPDLSAALEFASEVRASEFLLLPQEEVPGLAGVGRPTLTKLHDWIAKYRGPVPLSISEPASETAHTCAMFAYDRGLRAYAHIDATGMLKRSSFAADGVPIGSGAVIEAFDSLLVRSGEERSYENLAELRL